ETAHLQERRGGGADDGAQDQGDHHGPAGDLVHGAVQRGAQLLLRLSRRCLSHERFLVAPSRSGTTTSRGCPHGAEWSRSDPVAAGSLASTIAYRIYGSPAGVKVVRSIERDGGGCPCPSQELDGDSAVCARCGRTPAGGDVDTMASKTTSTLGEAIVRRSRVTATRRPSARVPTGTTAI